MVNKKFNKVHPSENDVERQINAPSMNKVKNMKKIMDQQRQGKKEIKLKDNGVKVDKTKDTKSKKEKVNPKIKHVANREDEKRKGKRL